MDNKIIFAEHPTLSFSCNKRRRERLLELLSGIPANIIYKDSGILPNVTIERVESMIYSTHISVPYPYNCKLQIINGTRVGIEQDRDTKETIIRYTLPLPPEIANKRHVDPDRTYRFILEGVKKKN